MLETSGFARPALRAPILNAGFEGFLFFKTAATSAPDGSITAQSQEAVLLSVFGFCTICKIGRAHV